VCIAGCGPGTDACVNKGVLRCYDFQVDPANCGGCGVACAPGNQCIKGSCAMTCPDGTSVCGSRCVDTALDVANCGGCGKACPQHWLCDQGRCALECSPGQAACDAGNGNTACVDLRRDPAHCGDCKTACALGQSCTDGSCACPQGLVVCGGACTNTASDAKNCGGCGRACATGGSCIASTCACPVGKIVCGGTCSDVTSDAKNCGGCGAACAGKDACVKGVCVSAQSAWRMLGGDAQHSGENVFEQGLPPLSREWNLELAASALNPVVVEDARVFVTPAACDGAMVCPLTAVDLGGKVLWSVDFAPAFSLGQPSVQAGRVLVQAARPMGGGSLYALDAPTGKQHYQVDFGSRQNTYWSPLVVNSSVYFDAGDNGGLFGYGVAAGTKTFEFFGLEQNDRWSATWQSGSLVTFVAGNLRTHDPKTGNELWSIPIQWSGGGSMSTAPVAGDALGYVVSPPNLYAYKLNSKNMGEPTEWTVKGNFVSMPSYSAGVVYGLQNGTVEAHDGSTGKLLWSFAGDNNLAYPAVIANKYLYVASDRNVYCVDIAKQMLVWTAPVGGWLSIGAGYLFVARADGLLSALKFQ
jgi:hypothetical protein